MKIEGRRAPSLWYFQDTARLMRGAGHEVYTPTLTGIGERVHLGRPDTDLDTHIQDIVNVLEYEDLRDVALVGFSRVVYPEFLPVRASIGGDCGQGRGARVALSGAGRRSHGTGDACPGAGGPIACA